MPPLPRPCGCPRTCGQYCWPCISPPFRRRARAPLTRPWRHITATTLPSTGPRRSRLVACAPPRNWACTIQVRNLLLWSCLTSNARPWRRGWQRLANVGVRRRQQSCSTPWACPWHCRRPRCWLDRRHCPCHREPFLGVCVAPRRQADRADRADRDVGNHNRGLRGASTVHLGTIIPPRQTFNRDGLNRYLSPSQCMRVGL